MEAADLYARFEDNLNTIVNLLNRGVDIRTTPLNTTMPLEVERLCEILNKAAGMHFSVSVQGAESVKEFQKLYLQDNKHASHAIHKIMDDKRSFMKTPEGTYLTKELMIARLVFFNEAAHQMEVIATQKTLGSPKQYNYPYLNA